ncbi:transmembrane protein 54-like isoform 2-T2 [Pholidichthys leucotaenia]
MADTGLCCGSLEDPKVMMKMGLSVVLVGHVNFLLGALVHGVVLRHINLHKQARAMEYAISNVVAITAGMVGIFVGVVAIVLSKNKKSKCLTWTLFSLSLVAALMAAASVIGLFVSVVKAIIYGGRSLLTHCRFPDAVGYSSVTNECPFDPTRIYINKTRPTEETVRPRYAKPPRVYNDPPPRYATPPRIYNESPRQHTAPPRPQRQPPPSQQPPREDRRLSSERQPLRQPSWERSDRRRREMRDSSQRRAPEQHQLLQRSTLERSSFWI